jgi:FKBP-type peptidyl-prolyl cis-trans isomerase 2
MSKLTVFPGYLLVIIGITFLSGLGISYGIQPSETGVIALKKQMDDAVEKARKNNEKTTSFVVGENPNYVQNGDLAEVGYTLSMTDGSIVYESHNAEKTVKTELMIVGAAATPLMFSRTLLGMKKDDTCKVLLPKEDTGIAYDNRKLHKYPREKQIQKNLSFDIKGFEKQFGMPPQPGRKIVLTPFFSSVITDVTDTKVILNAEIPEAKTVKNDLGTTEIIVKKTAIILRLTPDKGAKFFMGNEKGVVTDYDDHYFTVDFNPVYAGKELYLSLHVKSLVKSSAFLPSEINWTVDYGKALETAVKEGKNLVVFLYSDTCPWCKRMEDEVLYAPGLRAMEDDFLWVKINSGKERFFKEQFEQTGYPLTLIIDFDEVVHKRMKGFKSVNDLLNELRPWTGRNNDPQKLSDRSRTDDKNDHSAKSPL